MKPSYRMWNLVSTQIMGTLLNHGKSEILKANVLSLNPLFLIVAGKVKRSIIKYYQGKHHHIGLTNYKIKGRN